MKLIGQRWEYRVGNSIIHADNGFSWNLWAQERFSINGEAVSKTGGLLRVRATMRHPWLSHLGEGELKIALVSAIGGIACKAFLDDQPVEPERISVARWVGGRQSWPEEDEWRDDVPLEWVSN